MVKFMIGGREVGPDHPPLVIAEVGINHEGSLARALELVDAASDAGCEAIKFQTHITEMEMIPTDMTPGEISTERLWDIMKRCELTEAEEREVQARAHARGLIYFSTPFSREAADRLATMDVPVFKIGSGECNNLPLLRHVGRLGRPVILSTGMNDLSSIKESVRELQSHDVPVAVMHCTSMYPTPYEHVRLGALRDLQEAFPGCPVGLSDHSLNVWTCLGAVALSACLLEKHFTLSRSWPGPDTGFSIEPTELRALVEGSRAIWKARGGTKTILPQEQPVIDFAYATVVTIAPIAKGDVLTLENIWVKRPGTGPIPARDFESVLGRIAARDLASGRHVAPADLEP